MGEQNRKTTLKLRQNSFWGPFYKTKEQTQRENNTVVFVNVQKGVFSASFSFAFWCVFCLFVFVFLFCKRAPPAVFLQFWSCFFYSVPPSGLSLKSLVSSYSVLLVFLLYSLSKCLSFFFVFCPSTPLWKFVCLSFYLLFPLWIFACFFEADFPDIPFLKPKLPSCLNVYVSSVVSILFSWCVFLPLCYVGFVFGMSFFHVYYVFVVFLVLPSDYEKKTLFCLQF